VLLQSDKPVSSINTNYIENRFCLQRLVSIVKFVAERGLAFRNDETVGSPRNFFQIIFQNFFKQNFKKQDAMLLVTGFATVLQIANHYQISCYIIKFCYT